jgi:hypothetical protein
LPCNPRSQADPLKASLEALLETAPGDKAVSAFEVLT